jgi:alkylation response protein AidB-like acyl-CoA dehydrogenase
MQEIFLDEDTIRVRDMVARLVADRIASLAEACDEEDRFPAELKQPLFDAGLLTMPVPEKHGGSGASTQALSVTLEEVSRGFATMGPVLLSTFSPIKIVAAVGKEHQQRAFFRAMTEKPSIAAFCLSEPHCGSDARAIRTQAVRKGSKWVINGQKRWITNGSVADQYLLFCRTGEGGSDISVFVVPSTAPGLSFGKKERKMGLRGGPMCDVILQDVEVGEECLIGEIGEGWRILERVANTMRCGGPLRSASASPGPLSASRRATPTSTQHSDKVLGGYGYVREYQVERMMRDAKVFQILDGSNEVQRILISRHVLNEARA